MRSWLATYIKGERLPAPPLLEMQLRSNKQREQFDLWPSPRIKPTVFAVSQRGGKRYGALEGEEFVTGATESSDSRDSITFGRRTGISAGEERTSV